MHTASMKCAYHPAYQVSLPAMHPFPMSKYYLLKDQLLTEGVLLPNDLLEPEALTVETLALVHTREYLNKLQTSSLSAAEVRRLGMPWSESLWKRSRLASAGTLLAARTALAEGMAANLAGGTHHAFADHGEGFCVVNDIAISIVKLRTEGLIERALIIDLDVHQGNGTAAIFEGVEAVFTFSMHGERNYPTAKMRSTLDVGLPNGMGDGEYLQALGSNLPRIIDEFRPHLAFYVAGVDVAAGDRYGKLSLSDEGIRQRDRLVIETVRNRGVPLTIVLGGGYAATRERTAQLHAHVFRQAVDFERRTGRRRAEIGA